MSIFYEIEFAKYILPIPIRDAPTNGLRHVNC